MSNYEPNSTDAMLSRIIARLDAQDVVAAATLAEVKKTNGRVTRLEQDKWFNRGMVAAVSFIASAAWSFIKR